NLTADLIKIWRPEISITVHRDYGLPADIKKEEALGLILSSYSGNTEEVIDAFEKAREREWPFLVVTTGGKLLALAKEFGAPHIQLPDLGLQPRAALGLSLLGILKAIGDDRGLEETVKLADILEPLHYEQYGKELAKKIKGYIPVIYSSNKNRGLAYSWKIKFNETGKIPAFMNVLPELNHNEMSGFDMIKETGDLMRKFFFIFLEDGEDHPQIKRRMSILKTLFDERHLSVETIKLEGVNVFHKIFSSIILADWSSYYIALEFKVDPDAVRLVEEFKKRIS
ncbi:hypothetical protein HY967_02145, partial [Candidatus Jorgensenbacteria bacterium]|nr:hypothetical protein [Candidatus Jorgensenbacteria bacterium]